MGAFLGRGAVSFGVSELTKDGGFSPFRFYDNYKSYRKKQVEEIVGVSYIRSPDLRYHTLIVRSKTGYIVTSLLSFIALM